MAHRTPIRYLILLLTVVAAPLASTACASSLADTSPEVLEYCSAEAADAAATDATEDQLAKEAGCIPAQNSTLASDPARP